MTAMNHHLLGDSWGFLPTARRDFTKDIYLDIIQHCTWSRFNGPEVVHAMGKENLCYLNFKEII